MTEEILTRWGELGVRVRGGRIRFCPLLVDRAEVPAGGALTFMFRRVPWQIRLGPHTVLRLQRADGWREVEGLGFDLPGVLGVEARLGPVAPASR